MSNRHNIAVSDIYATMLQQHRIKCHDGRMRSKQSEGVRCSKQCNQTEAAITPKVDLTTGHLVKLKTRHLDCTYSLGNITPIDGDWLSRELAPYKRQNDSVEDTINWHHLQHQHSSSSPVVLLSQKVSYEELQQRFMHAFLIGWQPSSMTLIGFLLM